MSSATTDRNLLFGILAVQNDLIGRNALIAAMNEWILAKHKPIGQILIEQGTLDPEDAAAIDQMISRRIRKTGGDVRKILKSLSSAAGLAEPLAAIGDTEIAASVNGEPVFDQKSCIALSVPSLVNAGVLPESDSPGRKFAELMSPENVFLANEPIMSGVSNSGELGSGLVKVSPQPRVGDILGRFRIVRLVDEGGQGVVYEATDDTELGRRVALKTTRESPFVSAETLRGQRALLAREGRLNARLDHPFIMSIYGLGTTDEGRPFYAMRFLDQIHLGIAIENFHAGRPLLHDPRKAKQQNESNAMEDETTRSGAKPTPIRYDKLEGQRSIDLRDLLNRFTDVCDAVQYAHGKRVLHRDLKPGNIMMGSHGETLVIDWGMARTKAELQAESLESTDSDRPESVSIEFDPKYRLTHDGKFIGTPGYAPPEQIAGDLSKLNQTTDVYALGMILFVILTGKNPFQTEELRAIPRDRWQTWLLSKTLAGSPDPLAINATVPHSLAAICRKALSPDQKDRYSTAAELSADIVNWLSDEPVSAYRENVAEMARNWARKNRGKAAAAAACLVFGSLASLGYAVQSGRNSSRLEAKNEAINAANIQITDERNRAKVNEKRAESREKIAIEAVKQYSESVSSNEQLKNRPELEELRKDLLKAPIEFFRNLRDDLRAENDPRSESLAALADGLTQLAMLTNEIGNKTDARTSFAEAAAIYKTLVAANPSVTEFRSSLAASLTSLGNLNSTTGRRDDARKNYARAIEIREALVAANPSVTEFRNSLAASLTSLGALDRDSGRRDDARKNYSRAIELREAIVAANPSVAYFRDRLAASLHNLGTLDRYTGRRDDARKNYSRAIELREAIVAANPTETDFRSGLASSLTSLGILDSVTGRPDDARKNIVRAIESYEALVAANPSVTHYRNQLAGSLTTLGALDTASGRRDDARKNYDRAIEIRESLVAANPSVTEFRSRLAGSLHMLGELESSIGRYEDARKNYARAIEILNPLVAANKEVTEFRSRLTKSLNNLEDLESANGRDDALKTTPESSKVK